MCSGDEHSGTSPHDWNAQQSYIGEAQSYVTRILLLKDRCLLFHSIFLSLSPISPIRTTDTDLSKEPLVRTMAI